MIKTTYNKNNYQPCTNSKNVNKIDHQQNINRVQLCWKETIELVGTS